MEQPTFEKKLADLVNELTAVERLHKSVSSGSGRSRGFRAKTAGSPDGIQDSLDFLRLSVKYLLFDLEATRRENAYLRRIVDSSDFE